MFGVNWGVYKDNSEARFRIAIDRAANDGKRYYRGELPRNRSFESWIPSPEPEFVRKKRQSSDDTPTYDDVSPFEYEIPEKV